MYVLWIRSRDVCTCVTGKSVQYTPKSHPRIWGSSLVVNETANDLDVLLLAGTILLALSFILKQVVQNRIHLHLQRKEHLIQNQHFVFSEMQRCHKNRSLKYNKIPTIWSTSWAHLRTWRERKEKAAGVESSTWRAKGWQLEESFTNEAGKVQDHSTGEQSTAYLSRKVKQIWQHCFASFVYPKRNQKNSSRATNPQNSFICHLFVLHRLFNLMFFQRCC